MKLVAALLLVLLNAFLAVVAYSGPADIARLAADAVGTALAAPAILALLSCVPAARRTWRHYLTGFLVASVLMAAIGVSRALDVVNRPPQVVATADGQLSITVPGAWKTPDVPNPQLDLVATDAMGVIAVMVARLPSDPQAPLTLEALSAEPAAAFPADKVQSVAGPWPCDAGGLRCVYHEVTLSVGEEGSKALVATVQGQRVFYSVVGTTSLPLYDDTKPQLQAILASLREGGAATR